jgi:adenylyltransferase/sulfurtransferase
MNDNATVPSELSPELLTTAYRVVEPAYPHEGCGFIFKQPTAGEWEVLPTENRAQILHEKDPERYPRGGGDWFEPNMKPWFQAERAGGVPQVIFHSHPDVGAYFSQGDIDSAVVRDEESGRLIERHPGVLHMVVSVRKGSADGAALFRFNVAQQRFDEIARFDEKGTPA